IHQQTIRHTGESGPEVSVRTHFLHVSRGPACLAGQDVELHEEHRLPYAAQAGVDQTALVGAGVEAFHQRLEALQVLVTSGQGAGLSSCSWGVRVVALVHGYSPVRGIDILKIALEYPREVARWR